MKIYFMEKSENRMLLIKKGEVVETNQISEGQRGKDLILTIDMELQQTVENIIDHELRITKSRGNTIF